MKTTTKVIISLILAAILLYAAWFLVYHSATTMINKYSKQKQSIDSLTTKIAELEKNQHTQDSLIHIHKDSMAVLSKEIESKNQKINDIRKYYDRKIKNTSNFTPTQLDSFFTNRYK